jgi:isocitrate/isopropylmalate dehydrogenase
VHGSAPDIAGKGIANPIAMIASFGMACAIRSISARQADWIDQAISATLAKGLRTADIKSEGTKVVSTAEMGQRSWPNWSGSPRRPATGKNENKNAAGGRVFRFSIQSRDYS